ncbi:hypothetical protein [Bradyrhizobium sp. Tv2a-2]|uniref:hypothetical protein n=1 Tax=Bradyrhizobium sp. Tv2a-2 TaxID=113395 RepID=UPI0012EB0F6D|nr:hypothetical protein [Bradyrhizobium sp. Tv2a-2]
MDSASAHAVELLLPPSVAAPVLWSPGASLVVRLSAPARLLVDVSPRTPGGSVAARIQSVQLSTDPQGMAWSDEVAAVDFSGLRVVGHLAGRGDCFVGLGEWLGGPQAPTRIEGVALDWVGRPANFGIRQAVRIGGAGEPKSTEFVEVGAFSGTRGRALPLVSVSFEVFGLAALGYEITAEALFLGSPQMRVTGQRVVVSGPTGREPLVGLKLQIAAPQAAPRPIVPAAPTPVADPPSLRPTAAPDGMERSSRGRVRVFRSRTAAKG